MPEYIFKRETTKGVKLRPRQAKRQREGGSEGGRAAQRDRGRS